MSARRQSSGLRENLNIMTVIKNGTRIHYVNCLFLVLTFFIATVSPGVGQNPDAAYQKKHFEQLHRLIDGKFFAPPVIVKRSSRNAHYC